MFKKISFHEDKSLLKFFMYILSVLQVWCVLAQYIKHWPIIGYFSSLDTIPNP